MMLASLPYLSLSAKPCQKGDIHTSTATIKTEDLQQEENKPNNFDLYESCNDFKHIIFGSLSFP